MRILYLALCLFTLMLAIATVPIRPDDSRTRSVGAIHLSASAALPVQQSGACPLPDFAGGNQFNVGSKPIAVAVADFNKDSRPDVVVVNESSNNISVLPGDGAGNLGAAVNYPVGTRPTAVAVGDFNGDNNPDLAVTNFISNTVSVLPGNGAGGFGAATSYGSNSTTDSPKGIAVADFNRDGKADLAVACQGVGSGGGLRLLIGNGTGGFVAGSATYVTTSPRSLAVADFNLDNKPDLVSVSDSGFVSPDLILGDGTGGFTFTTFGGGTSLVGVAAADFNQDGKMDVVVSQPFQYRVAVLSGNGTGLLSSPAKYIVGHPGDTYPYLLTTADFNLDGRADVAVANFVTSGKVSVMLGYGGGILSGETSFAVGNSPSALATGDFNRDGKPDLVVANYDSNTVSVLLNACTASSTGINVSLVAASYDGTALAPESIAAVFGPNLATGTQAAPGVPLPTSLLGTTVRIRDRLGAERLAPLFFVSPNQINYQIPKDTADGVATVTITSGSGAVSIGRVNIYYLVPGLFTADSSGRGFPAANVLRVKANGQQIYESLARYDTAQSKFVAVPIDLGPDLGASSDQVFLVLYGTGIRNAGSPGNNNDVRISTDVYLQSSYAGVAPGYVGLDQVNVKLPRTLIGRGEVDLVLVPGAAGLIPTNTVRINIK
ncbi:MAG: FG-GAP-like repeat-containing protein [Blastocatellia bacterium]